MKLKYILENLNESKRKYKLTDLTDDFGTFNNFKDVHYAAQEYFGSNIEPSINDIKTSLKRYGDARVTSVMDRKGQYPIWIEII